MLAMAMVSDVVVVSTWACGYVFAHLIYFMVVPVHRSRDWR